MSVVIPAVVLGGSGYVAGELLRLLVGHPVFRIALVVSESRAGSQVSDSFFHLRGTALDGVAFADASAIEALLESSARLAVFSALPHGEAAARLDSVLTRAEASGCEARVVDLSADFRHAHPAAYESIYGRPHGAPGRQPEFTCTLPELANGDRPRHVAHPGCFTTAATLALAPLVAQGWIEPRATVVAVTGSTGAGRTPTATTHHPERRSDLFAYSPLAHRHEAEMRTLVAAARAAAGGGESGAEPEISFVPQSGPFARGIHATIAARLARPASSNEVLDGVAAFYRQARDSRSPFPGSLSIAVGAAGGPDQEAAAAPSFVRVLDAPPRLQSVVGTNRCEISLAVRGDTLVAFSAIDNLGKGAAGGAVQWMNRLFDLPEAAGLALPGLGWL